MNSTQLWWQAAMHCYRWPRLLDRGWSYTNKRPQWLH